MVGDAWMAMPAIRDLGSVRIVCGAYDAPVWEWAGKHVRGCDWAIEKVIWNEDEVEYPTSDEPNPWVPGYGFITITKALAFVRESMPQDTVLGMVDDSIGSYYGKLNAKLEFIDLVPNSKEFIAVHPFTHHDWKNCDNVLGNATFHKEVVRLGYQDQWQRWPLVDGFDAQANSVVECAGMAGVLSSWTNLACLMHKQQIIVSFTDDLNAYVNPNATKMVKPSQREVQAEINRRNW